VPALVKENELRVLIKIVDMIRRVVDDTMATMNEVGILLVTDRGKELLSQEI
jgi:hypothetical protein